MRKIDEKKILINFLRPAILLYFKIWPANKKVWPPLLYGIAQNILRINEFLKKSNIVIVCFIFYIVALLK